jgi:flagellar motor switch protein FliM
VLHRLFSLVTEALGTALGPHLIGWPELLGVEIDPWAAVQRGGDAVAVASLELKGALSAQIDVALPIAWLRPTARPVRPTQTIEHALDAVELPVRVVLGGARRTLREVLALQVGDLVLLDSTESAPLSVAIGDRAKWHGRATRKGANHAVIVDGAIAREPPVR